MGQQREEFNTKGKLSNPNGGKKDSKSEQDKGNYTGKKFAP